MIELAGTRLIDSLVTRLSDEGIAVRITPISELPQEERSRILCADCEHFLALVSPADYDRAIKTAYDVITGGSLCQDCVAAIYTEEPRCEKCKEAAISAA